MKKYLVLIVLSLFTFTSCVDDDDFVRDPDLIGKWYIYSKRKAGSPIPIIFPHCKDKKTHLNFEENGKLTETAYSIDCKHIETIHRKYKLDRDILTTIEKGGVRDTYKYRIEANELIITTQESKPEYRIIITYKRME